MKRINISFLILISVNFALKATTWVDFDRSMQNSKDYRKPFVAYDTTWQLTKTIFNNFIDNVSNNHTELHIPKIIHQIWLGSPLPERCKQFQESWKQLNPDWQYILWTEKEIEEFGLVNKKQYDFATNYGEKSDIARYEILEKLGGVYVDTDFQCLRSFDILHYNCSFYAGISYEANYEIYNGLIGSTPGHPILRQCILNISRNPLSRNNDTMAIMDRTGPYLFTLCVQSFISINSDLVIFPVSYFYPWSNRDLDKNTLHDIKRYIQPESFAIHHWHRSWFVK